MLALWSRTRSAFCDLRLYQSQPHMPSTSPRFFVERMAAVETEMKKLTDIAVALARYDERILAMTTRLNLMDKRWEELRQSRNL